MGTIIFNTETNVISWKPILLRYDDMPLGEQFALFHDNVVASFSTVKMSIKNDALPLEDETTMLPQNTGN